jgi:TniQ
VRVLSAHDELLSSWLHRLAIAHGLSPRHFGECLGAGSGAWSARLDLALPGSLLNLLHHQTGVDRDRIEAMTIGAKTWRPLLLPLRRAQAGRKYAMWLQFCSACLAEDETPYFRQEWRARQRDDMPAAWTAAARSLSFLPERPRAIQPRRARASAPMRHLRI